MNDYLHLFEAVTHVIKISRELVPLLKLRGFNLTKFVSDADEISSAMNPEDCKTSCSPIKKICNGAEQSSHVLGVKWDHVKVHWLLAEARIVLSIRQQLNEPSWVLSLLCLTLIG